MNLMSGIYFYEHDRYQIAPMPIIEDFRVVTVDEWNEMHNAFPVTTVHISEGDL